MLWADSLKIKPIPSRVLIKLCSHYNDKTNLCYPSITSLQESCQLSRQGIINAIKYLEGQKIIEVVRGKNKSNAYKINTNWSTILTSNKEEVVNDVDQPSQRYGLEVVNEVDQGSQRGRPETVIKQEYKTVIKTNNAEAVLIDESSINEYYDKPPFSPDDISTKALDHRFDKFWSKYPVKKSKADAYRKWMKIKPDQNLLETMIKALSDQTEEKTAQKKSCGFAPSWKNPSTWLNQKCWEDEIYIPDQPNQRRSALDEYYDKPKKLHPSMEALGDEAHRRTGETPTQYWHRLERAKAKLRSCSEGHSVPMGSNDKNTGGILDIPNGIN